MPKKVWLLIIGMFVNVIGNSFLWPLNTIYMHDYLGKSLSVAGLVLMANAGAGVVGNLLGGFFFDKIGGYKSMMMGILISVGALIVLVINHSWGPYVVFLTVLGFSGGIIFPSFYAMVGTVWPEGGRRSFNSIYLSQNVGVAIGPALAGFVAAVNINYIFAANLAFYVLFFFIAFFFYKQMSIAPEVHTTILKENTGIKKKVPFIALLVVLIGYLLTQLVYSQWSTTISTHATSVGVTLKQYSLIWTINGLLIVLGQPLIKPLIKRIENQVKLQILLGLGIMLISFIVVSFANVFNVFVIAMVILTFGEMIAWPAFPALADQLAPRGKEGFYQGIVNSAGTIGKMIGPMAGGILADIYGVQIALWVLTGLMSLSVFPTLFYDIRLKRTDYKPKSY
ncbi:putative MFS-type transporter YttB [Sporosarcina sp. NCCP-2716]|uniref:MDR family MFS transporter n=1 Tax=Sporosarcina sp. NCCP-2716 TaxID=2943679 RepID=UPI0020404D3D|nr:MFS transporter [Sporosarcina sp. NCCP-2716]GKV69524.1 putative MFS-type transporter YttB [Sporosarcina sp. NCCP-2716]